MEHFFFSNLVVFCLPPILWLISYTVVYSYSQTFFRRPLLILSRFFVNYPIIILSRPFSFFHKKLSDCHTYSSIVILFVNSPIILSCSHILILLWTLPFSNSNSFFFTFSFLFFFTFSFFHNYFFILFSHLYSYGILLNALPCSFFLTVSYSHLLTHFFLLPLPFFLRSFSHSLPDSLFWS